MLSLWKKIVFSFGSIVCITSAVVLVVALSSENWVIGTIRCKTGVDLVNASITELVQFTGDIYFGLFQGSKTRKCGLGSRRSKIYIFPRLVRTLKGLHAAVILFIFVAIGFACVSLAFCIYNARKVPYQSIKGPFGLYFWNFIAGVFGALASLCFLASVCHHNLTETVANYKEEFFQFVVVTEDFGWSFWLCVASAGLHGANIIIVAMSKIHLPKIQTKKPEEPTVTGDDLLY